jgi:hypothetical protein
VKLRFLNAPTDSNPFSVSGYSMKRLIIIAVSFGLFSCKDWRISKYDQIVDKADRIVINDKEHNDSMVLTNQPMLDNMKNVLKRNIKPESPRKFLAKRTITLFSNGLKNGVLLISYGSKPYVNFRSDSLNITFPLNYGIGMSLDEMHNENNR